MARRYKRGRSMNLYGAFASKSDAQRRHKRVAGSFVMARKIKGHRRYVVLKARE